MGVASPRRRSVTPLSLFEQLGPDRELLRGLRQGHQGDGEGDGDGEGGGWTGLPWGFQ